MVDDYSSKSFRLMAMAVGTISNVGNLDLHCMTQQQIEAEAVDLELLALVVLTNHVRHDSKPTISELQDRYALHWLLLRYLHVMLVLLLLLQLPQSCCVV